jgi:hypothetical protein
MPGCCLGDRPTRGCAATNATVTPELVSDARFSGRPCYPPSQGRFRCDIAVHRSASHGISMTTVAVRNNGNYGEGGSCAMDHYVGPNEPICAR